jgi:hypothetical protein
MIVAALALAAGGVAGRGVIEAESSVFVPPGAAHGLWLELRE